MTGAVSSVTPLDGSGSASRVSARVSGFGCLVAGQGVGQYLSGPSQQEQDDAELTRPIQAVHTSPSPGSAR